MDEPTLLRLTAECALELPGSELAHPFSPDMDVYRVRGRMFALLMEHGGERFVNLKARPEELAELRRALPDVVRPGWHMNKRHWVSLHAGEGADEALVRDLVTESYLLVLEKLPRDQRPVDPATFGRPAPANSVDSTDSARGVAGGAGRGTAGAGCVDSARDAARGTAGAGA